MGAERIGSVCLILSAALCGTTAAQEILHAPDAASGDQFGWSSAVSGGTLLVGVRRDDTVFADDGGVWVFDVDASDTWVATAKLLPTDPSPGAWFGYDVDVDGDVAVVGATGQGPGGNRIGSATIFERVGGVWVETAALQGSGISNDRFGCSVAVSGDTVAVSAPLADVYVGGGLAITDAGAVYVYRRDAAGWALEAVLAAASPNYFDHLGQSLDLAGDVLLVGVPLDDEVALDAGAAYVFGRSAGAWTQGAKLTSPAAGHFGSAVSLSVTSAGVSAAVGTPDLVGGQVHVFDDQAGVWVESAVLVGSDTLAGDLFGCAVDFDGDVLMVGAFENDSAGTRAGAAYAFGRSAGAWVEVTLFIAPDAEAFASLGRDVAVSGDRAVAGAFGSNGAVAGGGATYALDPGPLQPFVSVDPPQTGLIEAYCLCDSGAPMGNPDPAAGCANVSGLGARLEATGSSSLAADDLVLSATNLPPTYFCQLSMGTPGPPSPFERGLLCIEGPCHQTVGRKRRVRASGTLQWGPGLVLEILGKSTCPPILVGETWGFQVTYFNRGNPTLRRTNTTNAVAVTFAP